jgi:hypothetical protein
MSERLQGKERVNYAGKQHVSSSSHMTCILLLSYEERVNYAGKQHIEILI